MYYIVTTRNTDYPYSIVETPDGLAVEADADCNHPTARFATRDEAFAAMADAINMMFREGDIRMAVTSAWVVMGVDPCTA